MNLTTLRRAGYRAQAAATRIISWLRIWKRLQMHRGETDRALVRELRARRFPTLVQWVHLPRTLGLRAKTLFYISLGSFTAGVIILFISGIQALRVPVAAPGGVYREGMVGSPRFIQPVLAASDTDRDLVALLFAPLFRVTASGGLEPALANSYEIGNNGRVITVRLREDGRWHDGVAMTAADVVFTIKKIQDLEWRSPLLGNFLGVNVQATGTYTVRFTLNEPFAPFLSTLGFPVAPAHVWKEATSSTVRTAPQNLEPVGSGPFVLREVKKEAKGTVRTMRLERNATYFGARPYLDEVVVKFYNDLEEANGALSRRGIDALGFVPLGALSEMVRNREVRVVPYELSQYVAVFWNTQSRSPLRDSAVRRALGAAVDRERILREAFGGAGELVDGPIPGGALGVPPPPAQTYDPVAAAEALTTLGWIAPSGEIVRKKDNQPLAFSITTVDDPAFVRAAERVRADLEIIGAGVALDIVPASKLQTDRLKPRAYEALLFGELVGADPDPYPFWHGSQAEDPGVNISKYQNRETDKLLEEARVTLDVGERAKRYDAFQKKLSVDAPALFLLRPTHPTVVSHRVLGVSGGALAAPEHRFWDIANWYVKVKHVWRWKR